MVCGEKPGLGARERLASGSGNRGKRPIRPRGDGDLCLIAAEVLRYGVVLSYDNELGQ